VNPLDPLDPLNPFALRGGGELAVEPPSAPAPCGDTGRAELAGPEAGARTMVAAPAPAPAPINPSTACSRLCMSRVVSWRSISSARSLHHICHVELAVEPPSAPRGTTYYVVKPNNVLGAITPPAWGYENTGGTKIQPLCERPPGSHVSSAAWHRLGCLLRGTTRPRLSLGLRLGRQPRQPRVAFIRGPGMQTLCGHRAGLWI
jgi:hypothetical protein